MCFVIFPTFSALYKHKSNPCYKEYEGKEIEHPIKITFPKDHLYFIGDCIESLEMKLNEEGGSYYVVVDKKMFGKSNI